MSIETSPTQAKATKQKGPQAKLCVKESSNYFPKATNACYAVPTSNHPTVLQPYSPGNFRRVASQRHLLLGCWIQRGSCRFCQCYTCQDEGYMPSKWLSSLHLFLILVDCANESGEVDKHASGEWANKSIFHVNLILYKLFSVPTINLQLGHPISPATRFGEVAFVATRSATAIWYISLKVSYCLMRNNLKLHLQCHN